MKAKLKKILENILHLPTIVILMGIAIFFIFLVFKIFLGAVFLFINDQLTYQDILEKIFLTFLYIEIIASIKIYFSQNYHFPLRFFLYIGITDLLRRIIIHSDDAYSVLLYTLGVLTLIIALSIYEIKSHYLRKEKKHIEDKEFEL